MVCEKWVTNWQALSPVKRLEPFAPKNHQPSDAGDVPEDILFSWYNSVVNRSNVWNKMFR